MLAHPAPAAGACGLLTLSEDSAFDVVRRLGQHDEVLVDGEWRAGAVVLVTAAAGTGWVLLGDVMHLDPKEVSAHTK